MESLLGMWDFLVVFLGLGGGLEELRMVEKVVKECEGGEGVYYV